MAATRRPLDFRTFDELRADVARLQANGYDQAGEWTLPQALDHLARAMGPLPADVKPLPRPARWVVRLFLKRLLKTRSMPRVPAPKPMRPPEVVDEADAVARFDAALDAAEAMPGESIDHPMFGHISVEDWQQLQLVHAARHLSFLRPR